MLADDFQTLCFQTILIPHERRTGRVVTEVPLSENHIILRHQLRFIIGCHFLLFYHSFSCRDFLDSVVEQISCLLDAQGSCTLPSLAQKFNLPQALLSIVS